MRAPALLAVVLFGASPVWAAEDAAWTGEFCALLRDLPRLAQEQKKADIPTLEAAADASDPRLSAPAALLLFAKDRPVEIFWWRKQARVSRAFVAALLLAAEPKEGGGGAPNVSLDSRRFRAEEAAARLEEVAFVKDHVSAVASLLAGALKSLGMQHQKSYEAFTTTARSAAGEPLSCVPDTP